MILPIAPASTIESPTIIGAQAADELLDISGIKASFVLTEYNGRIYVSARSIDEVNVQIIMERLGGGGHMNTAACQLEGTGLAEAIGILKRTIDSMLENGETIENNYYVPEKIFTQENVGQYINDRSY